MKKALSPDWESRLSAFTNTLHKQNLAYLFGIIIASILLRALNAMCKERIYSCSLVRDRDKLTKTSKKRQT